MEGCGWEVKAPLSAPRKSEKKEEDITHHGCGAAGAPSGLRSLSLLPWPGYQIEGVLG